MKTKILFVLIALMLASCGPMSKESYMEQYAEFMAEISQNASSYTEADWANRSQQYQQYSDVLHRKFQKDLTPSDKLTLLGYKIKYAYYRGVNKTSNELMNLVNSVDVESTVDNIQSYGKELMEAVSGSDISDSEVSEIEESLNILLDKIDTIVNRSKRELDREENELFE